MKDNVNQKPYEFKYPQLTDALMILRTAHTILKSEQVYPELTAMIGVGIESLQVGIDKLEAAAETKETT